MLSASNQLFLSLAIKKISKLKLSFYRVGRDYGMNILSISSVCPCPSARYLVVPFLISLRILATPTPQALGIPATMLSHSLDGKSRRFSTPLAPAIL